MYYKAVPVVKNVAKLLQTDSNAAAEYLIHAMKDLQPDYRLGGVDIVAQAEKRLDEYLKRRDRQDEWFIPTGLEELDNAIHGLQRGEEFVVIFARINHGKSWVLEKICTHIWKIGFNVGYISPEMGDVSIGYRFDTLTQHFSNKDLMWGNNSLDEQKYREYIETLKQNQKKFIVATPADFQKQITVTKLRNWIKQYNLDVIAIDGITYLSDECAHRGDNKTTALTNISEDLMSLSVELGIPIIAVTQANRMGVVRGEDDNGDVPDLDMIKDSDGIAACASKVISMRQLKNSVLRLVLKKQRFGIVGKKIDYAWNIDTGEFVYIPTEGDAQPEEITRRKVEEVRENYAKRDRKEVF